jgi:hypothetical protein
MLYALLILLAILVAFLMLNVRVRFQLSEGRNLLFVGLGRTGPEFDFAEHVAFIKLFGVRLKQFDISSEKKKKPAKVEKKRKRVKEEAPSKPRKRPLGDIISVSRKSVRPLWGYIVGLLKAVVVEEFEGQVEGGFDAPHLTGTVFGYYQAALAAAPRVVGRVQYVPDWNGPSFSGAARVSVAIPVYKLLARTVVFMYRLPLREIIKLAIGKKKGVSDV